MRTFVLLAYLFFFAIDPAVAAVSAASAVADAATATIEVDAAQVGGAVRDPVAWAKIATNIYKHVLGLFKPTAGIAVDPAYVEIFNEPDGGAWQGQTSTFNTPPN